MTGIAFYLYRGDNDTATTSFDVWAKYRSYPQCDGDGVFVGNFPIAASESYILEEWTPPNGSANWKLLALGRYMDQIGIPAQIEPV